MTREYPKSTITFKRIKIGDQEVSVVTSKKVPSLTVRAGSGPASRVPLVRIKQLSQNGVLE